MESPRKFNDCYFYYYSTCTKGDNCIFRHEPSALGCETMCTAWQQGKCLDKRCKLRHMELRKNRKQIPCYWENQPGGCRKKHCPFMHKNPDARTDGIAPSQPAPLAAPSASGLPESVGAEPQPLPTGVPSAVPPAPVPLLWQQQRQVVLDSAILGVLPASTDLLGGRRVLPPHPHEPAPNPYAPLPVDPLVVNFEEESDTESAPSSTPTKSVPSDERVAKSQELLLLEKIQAEAAAYYSYDSIPPTELPKERKIVRTNLTTKYDRLSLDELSGKKQTEKRNSLDFKVLSLDEIRARKKTETIIQHTPITINLNRKRKLSTHETIGTSGNKIIKVVRSNSVVYKKLDRNPTAATQPKTDQKHSEESTCSRKRTLSEISDIYDIQDDELVDNCHEFKRIKIAEQTSKPRLIRNRSVTASSSDSNAGVEGKNDVDADKKDDNDSDTEVQIVSVEMPAIDALLDTEIIDVDTTNVRETIDIVDLSEDEAAEADLLVSDDEVEFTKNVPDVVASCQKTNVRLDSSDNKILSDIDALLDVDL